MTANPGAKPPVTGELEALLRWAAGRVCPALNAAQVELDLIRAPEADRAVMPVIGELNALVCWAIDHDYPRVDEVITELDDLVDPDPYAADDDLDAEPLDEPPPMHPAIVALLRGLAGRK